MLCVSRPHRFDFCTHAMDTCTCSGFTQGHKSMMVSFQKSTGIIEESSNDVTLHHNHYSQSLHLLYLHLKNVSYYCEKCYQDCCCESKSF